MSTFDYRDTPLPTEYFIKKYGISGPTLWRYRREGLPAIAVGIKIFIRESEFVAFLDRMNGRTVNASNNKEFYASKSTGRS